MSFYLLKKYAPTILCSRLKLRSLKPRSILLIVNLTIYLNLNHLPDPMHTLYRIIIIVTILMVSAFGSNFSGH